VRSETEGRRETVVMDALLLAMPVPVLVLVLGAVPDCERLCPGKPGFGRSACVMGGRLVEVVGAQGPVLFDKGRVCPTGGCSFVVDVRPVADDFTLLCDVVRDSDAVVVKIVPAASFAEARLRSSVKGGRRRSEVSRDAPSGPCPDTKSAVAEAELGGRRKVEGANCSPPKAADAGRANLGARVVERLLSSAPLPLRGGLDCNARGFTGNRLGETLRGGSATWPIPDALSSSFPFADCSAAAGARKDLDRACVAGEADIVPTRNR
jgi:hypothetical protein